MDDRPADAPARGVEHCPKCGKPVSHYEDREVRVRWCGYPEPHYWNWQLKVPKLLMRP